MDKHVSRPDQAMPLCGDSSTRASESVVYVFVVEDEPEVSEGLCAAVQGDPRLRLSGQAASVSGAHRWLVDGRHRVDVLLVDLGLPDASGLELIALCQQLRPEVAIMVMTMFSDERHVFTALEKGASGYLIKSNRTEEIADHILELHKGGSPITPTVARLVLKRILTPEPSYAETNTQPSLLSPPNRLPALDEKLSAREIDVLNQIAVGYSTAEIAERFNISPHTVTAHIRSVYRKLQVHSRSAAIFEGQRHGLIQSGK